MKYVTYRRKLLTYGNMIVLSLDIIGIILCILSILYARYYAFYDMLAPSIVLICAVLILARIGKFHLIHQLLRSKIEMLLVDMEDVELWSKTVSSLQVVEVRRFFSKYSDVLTVTECSRSMDLEEQANILVALKEMYLNLSVRAIDIATVKNRSAKRLLSIEFIKDVSKYLETLERIVEKF